MGGVFSQRKIEMTATLKYCVTAFVIMPGGAFTLGAMCYRGPWAFVLVAAWIGVSIFLLTKIRCPGCGGRVYSPFGMDPFSARFFKSYKWGAIPVRCPKCDRSLTHNSV